MSGRKIEEYLEYSEDSASGLVWKKSPNSHKRKIAGTFTQGYWKVKFNRRQYVSSHLVLMLFGQIVETGKVVDHLDGNTSNNKIGNLRIVDVVLNSRNKQIIKDGKVGVNLIEMLNGTKTKTNSYWEVSWYEDNKLFRKKLNTTKFSVEDAVLLRDAKMKELNEKGYGYTDRHLST